MVVKTMPLNTIMLDNQTFSVFFTKTIIGRNPPGKFYVIGRPYIGRQTAAGTLVLFHLDGRIIVTARLQSDWWRPNDDPKEHPDARCVYLFDSSTIKVLNNPCRLKDLPTPWQQKWPRGRFDPFPRTLDGAYENEFLGKAT